MERSVLAPAISFTNLSLGTINCPSKKLTNNCVRLHNNKLANTIIFFNCGVTNSAYESMMKSNQKIVGKGNRK